MNFKTACHDSDELCERCLQIKFHHLFYGDIRNPQIHDDDKRDSHYGVVNLGVLDKDATCVLCRFFYSVRWPQAPTPTPPSLDHYHLRVFTRVDVSKYSFPEASGTVRGATVCSVVPGHIAEFTDDSLESYQKAYYDPDVRGSENLGTNGYFFLCEQSMLPLTKYYNGGRGPLSVVPKGLRVFPSIINYPLIKSWLTQCEHIDLLAYRKKQVHQDLIPIRCIDCESREVIRLPPGEEYVALSYVWGGVSVASILREQHPETGRSERLFVSEDAPGVIRDAITAVKNIGLRYLWVDQCCIDQTDSTDRWVQIKNMDNIYEGAFVTIVAAAGKDSSFGLPGVAAVGAAGAAQRPKREQCHVKIGSRSMSLVGSLPTAHDVIRESVWATRGWTYQEAVLSRRLLIFTEYQVHFVCPARIWSEDKASLWNDTPGRQHACFQHSPQLSQIFETDMFRRDDGVVQRMLRHFEQYSARHLTNEEDALDALRGLLTRFPFFTYYGLVLQREDTEQERETQQQQSRHLNAMPVQFFQSLWFSFRFAEGGDCGIRPRHRFPSWSWLGWKAPNGVSYHNFDLTLTDSDFWGYKFEEKATFWAEDNKGYQVPMANLLPSSSSSATPLPFSDNSRVIPELSTYLWVENMVLQLQFCEAHRHLDNDHLYVEVRFNNGVRGRIESVYMSRKRDDPQFQRLISEVWDCVLIYRTRRDRYGPNHIWSFLILEWSGNTAYRIGTLEIGECSVEEYQALLQEVPHSVRKMRLG